MNFGFSNPDEALKVLVDYVNSGAYTESRNGPVMRATRPTIVQYYKPLNNVLFDRVRNHNHFFAFFETLWMFAGRDDLEYLSFFNKNMSLYSDDGEKIRGSAYGKRWRDWFGHDQLIHAVNQLRKDPTTRRVVLTMWDASTDPIVTSKDIPCNTHVYADILDDCLDITVCNRSNDLIYGALGSNLVHFSYLLQFLSEAVGVKPGSYYQITNNLHMYAMDTLTSKIISTNKERGYGDDFPATKGNYTLITTDFISWLKDCEEFVDMTNYLTDKETTPEFPEYKFDNIFFDDVAYPLFRGYHAWKKDRSEKRFDIAKAHVLKCKRVDLKIACWEWLDRKEEKWKTQKNS